MDTIGRYLVTVSAAAILCSILRSFFRNHSAYSSVVQLLTGIFMVITILSPLINWNIRDISDYMERISWAENEFSAAGQENFLKERNAIISEKSEAYILDKAADMGADISAMITLSNENPPVPQTVTIRGAVSPSVKSVLEKRISQDLGISKENQTWERSP